MIIYCIVVYNSIKQKQVFHAAVGSLGSEPHFQKIKNHLSTVLSFLNNEDGIHTLKMTDGIYYAFLKGDQLAVVAIDEFLSATHRYSLFEKIFQAKNEKDLKELVDAPLVAVKSKAELIQERIDETVRVLKDDIDKLIEREGLLSDLSVKMEALSAESFKFSKRASDRKNQARCPTIFSFFKSIRDSLWGENPDNDFEYDYETVSLSKV